MTAHDARAPQGADSSRRTGWLAAAGALFSPEMTSRSYPHWIALALAHAWQDCLWQAGPLLHAARDCLGSEAAWLAPLAWALAARSGYTDEPVETLAAWLVECPEFLAGFDALRYPRPRVVRLRVQPARMLPSPFDVPSLGAVADLAQWLGLNAQELDWLASPAQDYREGRRRAAEHYRYALTPKARGGMRLLEAPLPLLKRVQSRIHRELLVRVPVHAAATGFVAGRSVADHAAAHAGRACVLSFDLRDFFPSVGRARVEAIFSGLGYAPGVAQCLAHLCTTRTPARVRERLVEAGSTDARRLSMPHLPQGAPSSPALANLAALALDRRLSGLAERFGARYTRYADDLCFSGPERLGRDARVMHAWVEAIARTEGFALRADKTRRQLASHRQCVTGLVVNERPNLPRERYDLLRARLHRLTKGTALTPELHAQMRGEISWARRFLAASRVAKLDELFAQLDQGSSPSS